MPSPAIHPSPTTNADRLRAARKNWLAEFERTYRSVWWTMLILGTPAVAGLVYVCLQSGISLAASMEVVLSGMAGIAVVSVLQTFTEVSPLPTLARLDRETADAAQASSSISA